MAFSFRACGQPLLNLGLAQPCPSTNTDRPGSQQLLSSCICPLSSHLPCKNQISDGSFFTKASTLSSGAGAGAGARARLRTHKGGYSSGGEADPLMDAAAQELYPYQGVASEDYNAVNTPAGHDLQAGTPTVGTQSEVAEVDDDDDDDESLNENDDDDDDVDDLDEGEEPKTHHLVLAQFDEVTRTKSRWKCTLKDGIMHINNKDILFTKATGEFDF